MTETTITYTGELTVLSCWCGIKHAVPATLRTKQLRDRDEGKDPFGIYCPLGHTHVPGGPSRVDAERRRRESAEARERHLLDQLEAAERSRAALKGEITKAKKRAAAGVCTAGCNRTFPNVAQHMATKHPDAATPGGDEK